MRKGEALAGGRGTGAGRPGAGIGEPGIALLIANNRCCCRPAGGQRGRGPEEAGHPRYQETGESEEQMPGGSGAPLPGAGQWMSRCC